MKSKVRITLKRKDNGKLLMEFPYDGPLTDSNGILDSAYERIKKYPETFANMFVVVEATDGNESLYSVIENHNWWSPKAPKKKRFVKIYVNGSETKIKIPDQILNGEHFLDNALQYAKEFVQRSFQANFPKGTPINIKVEVDAGRGRTMASVAQIISGMPELSDVNEDNLNC